MADAKISNLTQLNSPVDGDLLVIVDVSDTTQAASGTTKKITKQTLGTHDHAGVYVPVNAPITPATKTKITYDASGLVTVGADADLDDLGNVTVPTPSLDEFLKWNGSAWVNSPVGNTSAGASSVFFNLDTNIIATGANNDNELNTLSKTPSGAAEVVDTKTVNNNTLLMESYLYDTALGGSQIDGGVWEFDTYAGVDATAGTTEILRNVYKVVPEQGGVTVTITGTLTSRTATASGGTPFAVAKISVGGTIDSDSYLQTPLGLYRITARTSDTEVTITTPTTYSNESTVAFSVWKRLLQVTTGDIQNVSPAYALFNSITVQAAFPINATDKLGSIIFGKTDSLSNKVISFVHDGTTHYSHFHSPLVTRHNDLAGLQGGTTGEYYHLTSAQVTVVGNTSGTNTGDEVKATGVEVDAGADDDKYVTSKAIEDSSYIKNSGNAATATALATARAINGVDFDGSGPITIPNLILTAAPADTTATGLKVALTANENQAFGDVCYIDGDGEAHLIDADGIASMSAVVMCADATISANASGNYLMMGIARNDAWDWTVGGLIYGTVTGTTGNTLAQALPTETDDVVQIVGVATHADRMIFNPQLVQVELA